MSINSSVILIFTIFICNVFGNELKIVGGTDAEEAKYPYQISMQLFKRHHFCGGSILNEHWILTAAHCIHNASPENMTVVVGTNSLSGGGDTYEIEKLVSHPLYSPTFLGNDIALVKVKGAIVFGPKVQPIKLPSEYTESGANLTLTGWGLNSYSNSDAQMTPPDKLQAINLISIGTLRCRIEHYNIPAFIFVSNICTFTKEGQGSCSGDSGGPLVDGDEQVGVVSWGIPCAKGKPDVFTRVYVFLNWINGHIKKNEA